MIQYLLEGFLLGLAYASPIGVQNVFVISNALQNGLSKSLITSVIVAIMDISLAVACILGVGNILKEHIMLQFFVTLFGSIYLLKVAWQLMREIQTTEDVKATEVKEFNIWKISQRAFFLTWLNPHALLDGSAILGSYAGGLVESKRTVFGIGVASASLSWFIALSLVVYIINQTGNSAKYLKLIKGFSGLTIAFFAFKMLFNLVEF